MNNVSPACLVQIPPASKSFQEAQNDLTQTAADLNQSAGDVVHASRSSSNQLASASGKFSQDFDEFLDAGIEMAGHTQVGLLENRQGKPLGKKKTFNFLLCHLCYGVISEEG